MSTKVEIFFDVVSPYTYFGIHTLLRYEKQWNLEIVWRPVFLGGVMKGSKNQPPGFLPQRGAFLLEDLRRNAILFELPWLGTPSNFFTEVSRDVLQIQRLIAECTRSAPSQVPALVLAALHALHAEPSARSGDELHVTPELLARIAAKAGVSLSPGKEAKELLTANTAEAVERGVYGSPTFFVTPRAAAPTAGIEAGTPFLVFGSDRFEQLAKLLGKPYNGVCAKL
jgi:glutathione S-transferase kappa 1